MQVDIANALGLGTGINTTQLVNDLVSTARQPRETAIIGRRSLNDSRISALGSATSALNTFSTALSDLLKGTGFSGRPVSNDPSIANATAIPGGVPTGLPAQIEVTQLASAQVLVAGTSLASASDVAGSGTLTLTTAKGSFDVTLTSPANTLADLASAITSAGAGVTASVVTDTSGARLVIKGATGADQAFTLTPGAGADADLQRYTWDGTTGGMSRPTQALNANILIDNVSMSFASNTVDSAIPFVRIDLNKALPGTKVTIGSDQPTTTIRDLVVEYVSAYNELKRGLNEATAAGGQGRTAGALSGDAGVRDMVRRLSALNTTALTTSGPFTSLVDIGIKTARDGTLELDTARLDKAIADDPEALTQMLNPAVASPTNPGIAGALKAVTDAVNGTDGTLARSKANYENLRKEYEKQAEKLNNDMTAYQAQLTSTYSAMNSRLAALRATQSYLEQQVQVWTGGNN